MSSWGNRKPVFRAVTEGRGTGVRHKGGGAFRHPQAVGSRNALNPFQGLAGPFTMLPPGSLFRPQGDGLQIDPEVLKRLFLQRRT
ncbi:MAG: hypothetical protein HC923_00220 [Myxococcales bacterium]|nr:hypothetical protein [Myxococcales bacterium]